MASTSLSKSLIEILSFLLHERFQASPQHARRHLQSAQRSEIYHQFQLLHQLLCQRPATPYLTPEVLTALDNILAYQRENKILTSLCSIPPRFCIKPKSSTANDKRAPIRISLWRGDITTLKDVTAIVNAANSNLLGCFQPPHKCIDNVIHSAAGPRLRQEMHRIMAEQGHSEPVGRAKISLGFNLPAKYVIHTVGPSISNTKQNPSMEEKTQLASCYRACLDAVETLPIDANGRLSIAFCCISTGLFAFPQDVAAKIAIQTVQQWCEDHADTPITDILFDVFTEEDWALYSKELDKVDLRAASEISRTSTSLQSAIAIEAPASLLQAREWIHSADYLLITAGAGLSAAAGLDYTSRSLFAKHYPAYLKFGLERLYDTIGFAGWPSACEKWGYFFTHANLILQWPKSPLYTSLLSLASNFDKEKYFVRTSNADGLFAANGFPPDRIATPQGQYKYVQCFAKCRPDAVFPMAEYLENALPFIDPETQSLTDPSLIPHCRFCGTELTLCVRGGSYFNEAPFCKQEEAFDDFLEEIEHKNIHGGEPTVVVLELGVGLNTPSVLRWPNEELARSGEGKFKLVRMGLGPSACVPFDLVEEGVAVVVDGDVGDAVGMLTI